MRPIHLTMSAFNSYAGVQEIDFSSFGTEGLFLITGPTGSGKTTIFDGMMYALFGTACSKDRTADMVRSLVCDPKSETFVSLEFESQGKRYSIRRSPKYRRVAKRGKGEVSVPASVELKMPDGTFLTKAGEVEEAIQKIISLDKNQFRQVALLAQGDFRQILTGDTASRMKILRSLFGTDRYEQVEEKLKDRRMSANNQAAALKASIESSIKAIEGYKAPDVFELEAFASWNQAQKERLARQEEELAGLQKKQDEMNHTIGQLEEKKKNWDIYQKAIKEAETWKPRLDAAHQEIQQLDIQKPVIEQTRRDIQEVEQAIEAGIKKKKLEAEAAKVTTQIHSGEEKLKQTEASLSQMEEQKKADQQELEGLQGLEEKGKALHTLQEQFARIEKTQSQLESLEQSASQANAGYQKTIDAHHQAEASLQSARALYLEGQAGILAAGLQENKPCPVCGATSHPHPAILPKKTPTSKELDSLQKKADAARKNMDSQFALLNDALANVQSQKSALEALKSSIPDHTTSQDVQNQLHLLHQQVQRKNQLIQNIHQMDTRIEEQTQQKERWYKTLESLRKSQNTTLGQIQQLFFPYASMQEAEAKKKALSDQVTAFESRQKEAARKLQEATKKYSAAQGILESMDKDSMEDVSAILQKAILECNALEAHVKKMLAGIREQEKTGSRNQKIEADLRHYISDYKKQQILCSDLKELYEALNGGANLNGQGRMDLETYVQAAYYEQVLEKANLRLIEMSDGRYSLQRRQEAAGNSKVGLDLDILDRWNMKVRPASGLSGGESFMASLALALGLSDAIMQSAGGSVLDTLFVDEGFGSLDSDALDKAVGTLRRLAGSRLVGIISHVDAIKQNIESQIVVSQDKDGKSHAKVIA